MVPEQIQFLKKKVLKVANRNSGTRLKKWLFNFHKIIIYKSIALLNKTLSLKVKTIWEDEIEIILPEMVSINIFRNGFAEADVTYYLLEHLKEGQTFIDIGAHFGSYSLLASNLVGKKGIVISFEPTPSTFTQLKRNIVNNEFQNIRIYNYAVFDKQTKLIFSDFGIVNSAFNSFFRNRGSNLLEKQEIEVETVKLDDFLENNFKELRIDLIKIDAESSEYFILQGSQNIIKIYKPKIILEVGDFSIEDIKKSNELVNYLYDIGYIAYEFDLDKKSITPYIAKANETYKNLIFQHTAG